MIRYPVCWECRHYENKTESCPAYPDGIKDEFLFSKKRDNGECGNGIKFEEKK